jgi:glycosyltransferase involved in cell wall biosynthesis
MATLDDGATRPDDAALAKSDALAMDAVAFNMVAARFYETRRFDLVAVSFIPDMCGLSGQQTFVLHLSGLPPSQAVADLESHLLPKVSHFVSASSFVTREFLRLFRASVSGRRVHLLHPGIAEEFFDAAPSPNKTFDISYVGRLTRRKGVSHLLDALATDLQGLTCIIVGDGNERARLMDFVRDRRLHERVTVAGAQGRRQVVASLDSSRVFVYVPVLPEAFGCAPLEAMARGIPVVTTNLGGMTEYVQPERNAIVCEPANPKSLARAVTRLIEDPKLHQSMAAAGRATAQKFTAHLTRLRTIRLYEELISASPPAGVGPDPT